MHTSQLSVSTHAPPFSPSQVGRTKSAHAIAASLSGLIHKCLGGRLSYPRRHRLVLLQLLPTHNRVNLRENLLECCLDIRGLERGRFDERQLLALAVFLRRVNLHIHTHTQRERERERECIGRVPVMVGVCTQQAMDVSCIETKMSRPSLSKPPAIKCIQIEAKHGAAS